MSAKNAPHPQRVELTHELEQKNQEWKQEKSKRRLSTESFSRFYQNKPRQIGWPIVNLCSVLQQKSIFVEQNPPKQEVLVKIKNGVKTEHKFIWNALSFRAITHSGGVRLAVGGQGQHPPPSPHVRRRIDESAAFAASITPGLCAHVHRWCTHVTPAPPPHIIHLIPPDPSVLTDAISPDDSNSDRSAEGLLLGGPLEYKKKEKKETRIKLGCRFLHSRCLCFRFQTDKRANSYFIKLGLIADAGLCFCSDDENRLAAPAAELGLNKLRTALFQNPFPY